jgi:glucarate dehydratase
MLHRRDWLRWTASTLAAGIASPLFSQEPARRPTPLKITNITITPIALPDPPILAASGCHGPYFLRNIVRLETDGGIVGIAEARGGQRTTEALQKAAALVKGQNVFAYRSFFKQLFALNVAAWAGIELACLDAASKATGRRLCELLGGPVRDEVEFAAYLFYRYAADHPKLLADPRVVDGRGKGAKALDDWGEVRTPEALVKEAARFREQWGFRAFKLKGGVLTPEIELETMKALDAHFGKKMLLRIDPNGVW